MIDTKELIKKPVFLLKCVELVATIVSISLLQDIGNAEIISGTFAKKAFVYMVMGSYLLLIPMQIAGMAMEQNTPKNLELTWALLGSILWIAAGSLLLESYYTFFPYGKYVDKVADLVPGGKLLATGINWAVENVKDQFLSTGAATAANGCVFLVEAGILYREMNKESRWAFIPLFKK